jgi:hypothetical protein
MWEYTERIYWLIASAHPRPQTPPPRRSHRVVMWPSPLCSLQHQMSTPRGVGGWLARQRDAFTPSFTWISGGYHIKLKKDRRDFMSGFIWLRLSLHFSVSCVFLQEEVYFLLFYVTSGRIKLLWNTIVVENNKAIKFWIGETWFNLSIYP